ncbi:hypothetical protein AJ78_07206 [Emergomyces pasteurianus Ep9510]|uniref:Uncharacterized protein n=1 Tax=Emergomyces pasteurianus Ep9510 TaxID=1447872 RepID=A0A1J9QAE2_9EURO|nr:hypothetical protein AJ78_07206 [Emergomyces pasteurianus Ep9510]
MSSSSQSECEQLVRSLGFSKCIHLDRWPVSEPASFPLYENAYYAPHAHVGNITHLILGGSFTTTYPHDTANQKEKFGSGARVESGKVHEVWIGLEGCEYVIRE